MPYFKVVCGVLIWAVINGFVVRGVSQNVSPTMLGAGMSIVGLLPLLFLVRWGSIVILPKKELLLLGLCSALNNSLFYTAIAIKDVSTIVLVHYFAAALAVLWAYKVPILHERPSAATIASVAIGLVGLLIMLGKNWLVWENWMIFALLSAFFYSWEIIYGRVAGKKRIPPVYSSFTKLFFQASLMPIVGMALGQSLIVPLSAWPAIAGAGILLVVSFWLVFSGLMGMTATHFSMLSYLDRIGAIAIGFLWWGEPITMPILIGGGLILAAEIPILLFRNKKEA